MCEPVSLTAASMGIAAAGAGTSIMGQRAQNSAAKQVEDQKATAVDEQIQENRRRATADYLAAVMDEQLQQAQEMQALAEHELDMSRDVRDAKSKATVAAAESGVAGQSLELIKLDYDYQMSQAAGRLGINQDNANYQHTRNIQAYGVQYQNRAASVQPYTKQMVRPVDYFGPIFGAFGQGLNTAVQTQALVGTGQKVNPLTKALVPPAAGGPIY